MTTEKITESSQKAYLAVVALIFIFFIVLAILAYLTLTRATTLESFSEAFPKTKKTPIGVVEITGVIMESKDTIELLKKAEEDEDIKAIIVRIDSPGGAVGPTQEIYEEIRRIDKEKPVMASFGSIAASGGYYVAAATRKIYANPGTLTGSIGVIMNLVDLQRLYDFLKIGPRVIKAGIYKDMGSPNRDMTPEEEALFEELLKDTHDQFIQDIARVREGKIKKDLVELAQGQIFSGRQAFEHGLVDGLGGLEKLGRDIHKELEIKAPYGLKIIKKKKNKWELFLEQVEGVTSTINSLLFSLKAPGSLPWRF